MLALPRAANLSAPWTPVGPFGVANPAYGVVSGRITAIAIDPADTSGNTIYLGTTGGGVWKSINAAGPAASVAFAPLTDTLPVFDLSAGSSATPSLSIGALAVGGGIVLAGTGDPNDATDSYYGGGLLRSADGGLTWTLVPGSRDGSAGNHTFVGMSTAGIAFSTLSPNTAVAAFTNSVEGNAVNAGDTASTLPGLYVSNDAGRSWQASTVLDGSNVVASSTILGTGATAVVWSAARQRFYAVLVAHGYFESADGVTWTRMAHQPGAAITASCAFGSISNTPCPVFRGALAVQPATGDLFALTVDGANNDLGLFQDACGMVNGSCATPTVRFGTQLNSASLEAGSGSAVVPQGDYNLALAASPSGADTVLYVGTIDLFRCTLAGGCVLRNTTNAQNGCADPARIAGAQHALATNAAGSLLLGNDGGLWRSVDGVAETGGVCNPGDAGHFENLNSSLGSLAEVTSFSSDPADPATLLAGLGALGSAGTNSLTEPWPQMATGEGGTVSIDQIDPDNWYVSTGAGINIGRCTRGAACRLGDFATTTIGSAQVAGDLAEVHAPWLLDPSASDQVLLGTCRAWRGPATGVGWTGGDLISEPFAAASATGCSATLTQVRSIAAGGVAITNKAAPNRGSGVLFAGMAGSFTSGATLGGHVLTTAAAGTANSNTQWTDVAGANVTNAQSDNFLFNPGGFDVSSLFVDPHDAAGNTVYATVMGFAGNQTNSPHLYRTIDGGAHWTNISSNLPNAPANSVLVDPNDANTIYVALDTGVYVTTSVIDCVAENCWGVYGASLPNSPVLTLQASADLPTGDGRKGQLRAGTYGRGIWQIPLVTAISPAVPDITLSQSSITFPPQQVGTQSVAVTIIVLNGGTAPLQVTRIDGGRDFAANSDCVGATIAPAATCNVAVQFSPTATGSRVGILTVYGNVVGGQATATLSGLGTPPAAILLTPLNLPFGPNTIGTTSRAANITVSNTGGAQVVIQSVVVSGDFAISASSCGTTLSSQTGCTIFVTFRPVASGPRTGTLTLADSVGTQVASLTGTGTSPATDSLSALSLSFPLQQIGSASAAKTITLTNLGDVALSLIATATTGSFSTVNGCGASLSGHSTCKLIVSYVPGDVGLETGILAVSDAYRTQNVLLNGIGAAPPGVSLAPAAGLVFAPAGVGIRSSSQAITLTNNGDGALSIGSASATADFIISANLCGTIVAAHSACSFAITYLATQPGLRSGRFTLVDSAVNSPQALTLSGTGIDFTLSPDGPASVNLSSGQTATYLVLLGSLPGLPGNVIVTCAGLPAASACIVSPSSAALGAANGTVLTVSVATGLTATAQQRSASFCAARMMPVLLIALVLPLGGMLGRSRGWSARQIAWRQSLPSLLVCGLLLSFAGCTSVARTIPPPGGGGGGGPNPAVTPAGTYTINVAGSSAGLVRAVNLTLVVQ